MSRFLNKYRDEVIPALTKQFGYKTEMQVPRITKITLNMGVGDAVNDKKLVDHAVEDLTKISGQKPIVTKTRKAIANFKIRETCRSAAWSRFAESVCMNSSTAWSLSLSRVFVTSVVSALVLSTPRQLQHRSEGTDHFPEIEYDKIDKLRGMNISITTTAKTDEEAKALLAAFHFPFRN